MGWEGRGESRVEDRGQEEVDVENLCSVFVYRLYSQWEIVTSWKLHPTPFQKFEASGGLC